MPRGVVSHVADRARTRTKVVVLAVLGEGFFGGVPAINVALMMGIVMPCQDLFIEMRFKRVILVRKGVKFVAHRYLLQQSIQVERC